MEEIEAKRDKATAIAVKAGVLERCEYHEDIVFETGEDVVEAYRRGNARFETDSLGRFFDSRREMTDYIKEVVNDAAMECWCCEKLRGED